MHSRGALISFFWVHVYSRMDRPWFYTNMISPRRWTFVWFFFFSLPISINDLPLANADIFFYFSHFISKAKPFVYLWLCSQITQRITKSPLDTLRPPFGIEARKTVFLSRIALKPRRTSLSLVDGSSRVSSPKMTGGRKNRTLLSCANVHPTANLCFYWPLSNGMSFHCKVFQESRSFGGGVWRFALCVNCPCSRAASGISFVLGNDNFFLPLLGAVPSALKENDLASKFSSVFQQDTASSNSIFSFRLFFFYFWTDRKRMRCLCRTLRKVFSPL